VKAVTDRPSSRQMMSALPSGTTRNGGLFGIPRRAHTAATCSRSSGGGLASRYVTGSAARMRQDYGVATSPSSAAQPRPPIGYSGFSQTDTWLALSLVKGSRLQSLQRSRKVMPASCAIRSSSEGHT